MIDTAEEAAFRDGLRAWFRENLPPGWGEEPQPDVPDERFGRGWSRRLFEAGYAGLTWPREYGGRGLSPVYQAIYYQEAGAAEVPVPLNFIGINMAGPTIIQWGTDAQKNRFLPPLLAGEHIWCQGFSEPGSGSDLASIRTRAVRDGDDWVIDGQKVWSSFAHAADWCILLVRTDPDEPKHAGLSYLLVDMGSPGIEIRPLRQLTGEAEFNEIFFTAVRVPADSILGSPGQGWQVALTTLMHERGTAAFGLAASLQRNLRRLIEFASLPAADGAIPAADPVVRDAIARQWVACQALHLTNERALATMLKTGVPGPEGSVAKLAWTDANQQVTKLARSLEGMAGSLDRVDAPWSGFWQYEQLRSRGNSIEGGTSEIQRNIVAERILGLPRSR